MSIVALFRVLFITTSLTAAVSAGAGQSEWPTFPFLWLRPSGSILTNRERTPVQILISGPIGSSATLITGEIAVRGSSSRNYPKKPYRFECQEQDGNDLKISILGMPAESDWILYSSYVDKTFVRDVLAYDLWREMGYYAPRWRFVELFIGTNSIAASKGEQEQQGKVPVTRSGPAEPAGAVGSPAEAEYQGLYILIEKIKRGKDRVNIQNVRKKHNGELDVTGGYIFKRDKANNDGDRLFRTSRKVEFILEEPKPREITPEQQSYLTNYLNAFEQVLFSESFSDQINGYERFIDVNSFVDYHWMMEVMNNVDGYWHSQYYYKDRGGRINMGPIWDCDMAFGLSVYNDCHLTNGWRWQIARGPNYKWFGRLFEDAEFLQRYIDRWSELRTNTLATSNVLARIDSIVAQVRPAIDRNYQRWPILGKRTGPAHYIGQTYEDEVKYLKDWIVGRLAWIDSEDFPKPTLAVVPRENVLLSTAGLPGTQELRMTCEVGSIFYTTDGSDPRLRGGDVSPKAKEYKTPLPIQPGLKIKARVRSEYGLWSAPAVWP